MVIDAVSTLALYCPRCGKIQMHDFSRFTFKNKVGQQLVCSCGQTQATITSISSQQCLLDIPCVVCETNHVICLDRQSFWQKALTKIYCVQENFELGFVGSKEKITETIQQYKREFEKVLQDVDAEEYGEYVENPQVMIEILNRIHDIAEKGGVYCRCGSSAVEAELAPDCIHLECAQCGGHKLISAHDEQDVVYMGSVERIEILPPRRSRRKQ